MSVFSVKSSEPASRILTTLVATPYALHAYVMSSTHKAPVLLQACESKNLSVNPSSQAKPSLPSKTIASFLFCHASGKR